MAAFVISRHIKPSFYKRLYDASRDNFIIGNKLQAFKINPNISQCQLFPTTIYRRKSTSSRKKVAPPLNFPIVSKQKQKPVIKIWANMTVAELAAVAGKTVDNVFEAMEFIDDSAPYDSPDSIIDNPRITQEIVKIFGSRFEMTARPNNSEKDNIETFVDIVRRPAPDPAVLIKRHPIVTVMGHVDHGKTTLLDTLRSTSVVDSEFGGITQHIGAFNVTLNTGERITFLDTPGHAAFSAMRARGAYVTDIVILVVAADDGVMEQTVQSIEMAKAADVPIIVAINKIDKPDADIERTKKMLSQNGIQVEDMGGDVQSVNISALKKTNIHDLMEAVATQAELMSLKGDPTGLVEAVVIEASSDPGRGKLATILIQRGTLKKGSVLVCGKVWGKVRSMFNEDGNLVAEGKLSEAVQVIGWRDLPVAGDEILEVESERRARDVVKHRTSQEYQVKAEEQSKAAEEKFQQHLNEYKENLAHKRSLGIRYKMKQKGPRQKEKVPDDGIPKVNIIVKGDVGGSVEAILDVLETYSDEDRCRLNLIHYGVGNITETDVNLAETFDAIIYSFHVQTPTKVGLLAKQNSIPIRYFNVIYKLIDDLKNEISSKLPPIQEEEILGEANVLQQFEVSEGRKKVFVAGCRCTKGVLKKSALFRLRRGNEVIHTGSIESLRHIKTEVDSIKNGVECGIKLKHSETAFQPGDTLICFKMADKTQRCDWDPGF